VTGPGSGELEPRATSLFGDEEVALVDLLDRLLSGGVVLVGDLTISLAGVDLVRISLRALIMSIAPVERPGTLAARGGTQRSGAAAPEAVTERADRELESGHG
jgi:hypothetical protein